MTKTWKEHREDFQKASGVSTRHIWESIGCNTSQAFYYLESKSPNGFNWIQAQKLCQIYGITLSEVKH